MLILLVYPAISQPSADMPKTSILDVGFGLGLGSFVQAPDVLNAAMDLNLELKASERISLYGSLGYNRIFAFGEGSLGYATLLAGPRGYISPKFFGGIGGGIAFMSLGGLSGVVFSYNPHIGFKSKTAQYSLGYQGIGNLTEDVGIIQLKTVFIMNKK